MFEDAFEDRHIGPRKEDEKTMLDTVGVDSINELIDKTVPADIRREDPMELPDPLGEQGFLQHMKELAGKNKRFRSYIGMGYYNTFVPPAIQRNILENPGWYTPYTPYQSEIAQGRLEALLNFQTMVMDLTGMELANASLLDESTAAAEAMSMFLAKRSRKAAKAGVNKFFVAQDCFPQTIEVLKGRAGPLGVELVVGDRAESTLDDSFFGALVQYPTGDGKLDDVRSFVEDSKEKGIPVVVAADLLSLVLLDPPGEWGADCVVGTTQRFGIPLGYGGPHAAYFATKNENKRNIPGRIIGVSVDTEGRWAARMALQTREQHIRKDKATSNICTAQALLAVMAGMYAVYHGPEGIKRIAATVHKKAAFLADELEKLGYENLNPHFFDTLRLGLPEGVSTDRLRSAAEERAINLRYFEDGETIGLSLDETVQTDDLKDLVDVFASAAGKGVRDQAPEEGAVMKVSDRIPEEQQRKTPYLDHPVFNTYHSETELMRYIKALENKDFSLTHGMIPLGSCTMKLNAVAELYPISWPEFANVHPYAPLDQTRGYQDLIEGLGRNLEAITGFEAISFMPNSGAQGEYTGLRVIGEYHKDSGESHRDIVLIPSSAHGTNPASGVMAGMKVVMVECDESGNIEVDDLQAKAEKYSDRLAALMVTYPSTHGVFEERIMEVNRIVHDHGGRVYMDGANMNAQLGVTSPARIGADVCHLNLHKTFSIPHGGGGPGMGPIGVTAELKPYLPSHTLVKTGGEKGIRPVASTPWGSASILAISYGYIRMLGEKGLLDTTRYSILNTNYLKERLKDHYDVLYKGANDMVAHEMILDCRDFKKSANVEVEDIAKRLIDYGFHAPTVAFPVPGTMMVEPTESESKEELDRFCAAMIQIRKEISEIEDGLADVEDNVLKNAPHTAESVIRDDWGHVYSREKAAWPLEELKSRHKFWPPVRRVDNAYGDRNLMCSCPPIESYMEPDAVEDEE